MPPATFDDDPWPFERLLPPKPTLSSPLSSLSAHTPEAPVLMNHTKARQIESTPDPSPYKDPREPHETITGPELPYKDTREP
ncbi:hypothetical protein ElyMa_003156000 [Elysia marginata]|uniref:Uncharacterized protein n=1 Tax=Elysia marginata TaxID=1093978 RepID=A0AAV4IVI0_9GAST|nr:hypothetical protein ElyMa_003156000 [Elysia marginata]